MSIEIPGPVMDLMQLYGLPWPDINEDAFHQLQSPLKQFGSSAIAVADAIDSALDELEASNHSQTLTFIRNHLVEVRQQYLTPINDICDDLAGTPCNVAYDAIHDLKIALLAILTGEVCTDVADAVAAFFTFGLSEAEAVAEMVVVSEEVQTMVEYAAASISGQLISMGEGYIDDFVNSIVNPFIQTVANAIDNQVDNYSPELAMAIAEIAVDYGGGSTGILHDADQVEQAVNQIAESVEAVGDAIVAVVAAVEAIFSEPDPQTLGLPSASSVLREVLKGVLQNISSDLSNAVKSLVMAVIDHFVRLLQDWIRVLQEMDVLVANQARQEKAAKAAMADLTPITIGMAADVVAGVAVASGLIDAAAAEEVQVGEAEALAFTATTTDKVASVAAVDAEATAVDQAIEQLIPPVDAAKVMVGVARAVDEAIDKLEVQTETQKPTLATASSMPAGPRGIDAHVGAEGPHLAAVGSDSAAGGVGHIGPTKDMRHEPRTVAAQPAGHDVHHLDKKDAETKSVIDDTPAESEF